MGLLLFVFVVCILRFNLPAAHVVMNVHTPDGEDTGRFNKIMASAVTKIIATDAMAGWQYWDIGILRVATSRHYDMTAIGVPFMGWYVFDNKK